jgi:chromate transport protein ChrA
VPIRAAAPRVSLATILREWGRIGCVGFGGPPSHIRLLRLTLSATEMASSTCRRRLAA